MSNHLPILSIFLQNWLFQVYFYYVHVSFISYLMIVWKLLGVGVHNVLSHNALHLKIGFRYFIAYPHVVWLVWMLEYVCIVGWEIVPHFVSPLLG